jgi:hypothetical protein
MRNRLAALALLAGFALSAGGCNAWYAVTKVFSTRDRLVTEGPVPPDFRIGIEARDVAEPPVDYKLWIDRSGKATYDVTVRQPRRRHVQGEFEVSDDQVVGLWNELVRLKFGELEDRYPSSGNGTELAAGAKSFYVFGNGTEATVETHYQSNEALEAIRAAVVATVPKEHMQARVANVQEGPKSFVGDPQTRLFHTPDCPLLKDLPEERKRPLATWYEAVDYRFQPCPDCGPSAPSRSTR